MTLKMNGIPHFSFRPETVNLDFLLYLDWRFGWKLKKKAKTRANKGKNNTLFKDEDRSKNHTLSVSSYLSNPYMGVTSHPRNLGHKDGIIMLNHWIWVSSVPACFCAVDNPYVWEPPSEQNDSKRSWWGDPVRILEAPCNITYIF